MALSRVKTWNAAETLTASDLNAEFNNICNHFGSLDNDDINSTATFTMGELIVGSGITSADGGQLHVHTASAGTIQAVADADEAVFENSAAAGITILSGTSSTGMIAFGDSGDADIGKISYSHSSNGYTITANAATALQISSAGAVTTGGSVLSDTDSTDSLGSASVRWANLYVDSIGDTGQALAITAGTNAINLTAGDVTLYDDNNNADTSISMGTSATEALVVQALNGGSNKTLEELRLTTKTASGTADHGKVTVYVDEAHIADVDDSGINLASGKTFRINGTNVVASAGDFSGPGSATDNAVVRFDGTGGKTAQNSGVTIDDSNNATGFANLTLSGELDAATGDFSGDVDVDGTMEADAITIGGTAIGSIYGAIAGSSSIVTTGALDSGSITSGFGTIDTGSSSITTTGAISSGALTATGNVSLNGGSFVFNEAGADKDFRIEGDTEANLFVADASTDRIGIGTATPDHIFHAQDVGANSFNTKFVLDLENTRRSGYTQAAIELASEYGSGGSGNFRTSAIAAELVSDQTATDVVVYSESTERMRIHGHSDSAGAVTKATHPAFMTRYASSASDATGNGEAITINGGTEVFDKGGNVSSGLFTAPVAGTYAFQSNVYLEQVGSSHTGCYHSLITTGTSRTIMGGVFNPYNHENANGALSFTNSWIIEMAKDDVAKVTIQVSNGTTIVDIMGSSNYMNTFSGYLVG